MYKGLRWAIGIITWERPELFKTLSKALDGCADIGMCDKIFIIDDASQDTEKVRLMEEFAKKHSNVVIVRSPINGGVSANSNRALKALKLYDFSFLLNDDFIKIKSGIFKKYMDAHLVTGIHSFGWNASIVGTVVDYNGHKLRATRKSNGVLMTATKEMLKAVGGFDIRVGRFGFEHKLFSLKAKKHGFIGNPNDYLFYDIFDSSKYLEINNETVASTQGKGRYAGFADKWRKVKDGVYQPYFGDNIDVEKTNETNITTKGQYSGTIDDASTAAFIGGLWKQEEVPLYLTRGETKRFFPLGSEQKKEKTLDMIADNPSTDLVINKHRNAFEMQDFSKVAGHNNRGWLYYAIGLYYGGIFPSKTQKDVIRYVKTTSMHASRYGWLAFAMLPEADAKRYFIELYATKPDLYDKWVKIGVPKLLPVKQLTDLVKEYNLPLRFIPTVSPIQKVKFLKILYSAVLSEIAPTLTENLKQQVLYKAIASSPFKNVDDLKKYLLNATNEITAKKDIEGETFGVEFSKMIASVKDSSVKDDKLDQARVLSVMKAGVDLNMDLESELKFYKDVKLVSQNGDLGDIKMVNGGANTTFRATVKGTPYFFKMRVAEQKETAEYSEKSAQALASMGVRTPMVKNIKITKQIDKKGKVKQTGKERDAEMSEFIKDFVASTKLAVPKTKKDRDFAMALFEKLSGESIHRLVVSDFMCYQQDRFVDNVGVDIKTGNVIAMDNDLSFGYYAHRPILNFMIRQLPIDYKLSRDERQGNWIEQFFLPAFDYLTYGEIGVNYAPEVIALLDEFSDNNTAFVDGFCPKTTRPEIKDAITKNLTNMMDYGFETAVLKYKTDIAPQILPMKGN